MKASVEVAEVFRSFGAAYRERYGGQLSLEQLRAMRAIEVCRTAVLGGHVEACDQCGGERISYNSCRNRHCPKCQGLDKERWREAQQAALLPVRYFHLVFTLPVGLGPLALRNQAVVYALLFRAASETLLELSADPRHLGARIGFTAVLHTWSQTLEYHPHLHCIVTGGGLSADGQQWVSSRGDFFLPVAVLSRLFRGKMVAYLKQAYQARELAFPGLIAPLQERACFQQLCRALYAQEWVVYCKPPFAGPEKVLDYLARYTHRVALSNERLVRIEGDQVVFRYRDRRDHDRTKLLTLKAEEFIRRFLLHVLPEQFVKIRHYGLLSNRRRQAQLSQARQVLGAAPPAERPTKPATWQELLLRLTGIDPTRCPHCGKGRMVTRQILVPWWQCRSP
jgi:hypothetical protein